MIPSMARDGVGYTLGALVFRAALVFSRFSETNPLRIRVDRIRSIVADAVRIRVHPQ